VFEQHFDLILENKGEVRHWIIGISKYREKRIAIEEKDTAGIRLNGGSGDRAEDSWGGGQWEIWDRGVFETEAVNSIRLVINAAGEKFRGRYLLLVPGWGRWTGKRLWVLEKIRENLNNRMLKQACPDSFQDSAHV
jgi:hypothetical protein